MDYFCLFDRLEMLRREAEKKTANVEHKALLESAYQKSQQRHEYAKAHPAYADSRVWWLAEITLEFAYKKSLQRPSSRASQWLSVVDLHSCVIHKH